MENGNITSTNPYNFTFGFPLENEKYVDVFINGRYDTFCYNILLLPWLILQSLNNVNLIFTSHDEMRKSFQKRNITRRNNEHVMHSYGVRYGIIDTTARFYYLGDSAPNLYHVSPYLYDDAYVILSSVETDQRDDSEVLSIQGLGDLVWVVVGLSLLAVSVVSSTITFAKRTRRQSRFSSFAETLWIYAADILNNSVACVKNVAAPLKQLRAWWLLGVVLVIQFWCAGLKSDILAEDSLLIDSLEDLMTKPKIICYFTPNTRFITLLEDKDSKYANLRQQLRRLSEYISWRNDEKVNEDFASGKAVVIEETSWYQSPEQLQRLNQNKRKLYVGKTKYDEFYGHMVFNKGLPRHIKERIDYVATRLTETRQLESRYRWAAFVKQRTQFSATSVSFTPMSVEYLTVIFRLWFIGLSLSVVTFCFEFFGNARCRKRFCRTIVKICKKLLQQFPQLLEILASIVRFKRTPV